MPAAPAAPRGHTRSAPAPDPLTPGASCARTSPSLWGPLSPPAICRPSSSTPGSSHDLEPVHAFLFAVPVAVGVWGAAVWPVPPPPASPARRALTRAAVAFTVVAAAVGTAAVLALIPRHHGVSWWDPSLPAALAFAPLLAARSARQRSQPAGRRAPRAACDPRGDEPPGRRAVPRSPAQPAAMAREET